VFVQVLGLSSIEMDAIFRADGAPIQLMLYAVNSSDFTSYTALVRVDFFRRSPAPLPKDTKLEDPTVEATVGSDGVRSLVSKKKRRWKRDGFDLDLTYVTERIIAMGFPSEALEGTYRNHMKDVQRFFLRRHSQNFKIYNLCSERAYDPAKFDNRVSHYPFDDHNPCPISTFVACCEDMRLVLTSHPQSCVALHCKAGKGRTGTVISAFLVYMNLSSSAEDALTLFGKARTLNGKGVTIPSQRRYVKYFENYCSIRRAGLLPPSDTTLFLHSVQLLGVPTVASKSPEGIKFVVTNMAGEKLYSSASSTSPFVQVNPQLLELDTSADVLPFEDDLKFAFHFGSTFSKKMFHFWINTRYLELIPPGKGESHPYILLTKDNLDKACKDKKKQGIPGHICSAFDFHCFCHHCA